jgi:hypothetical protein
LPPLTETAAAELATATAVAERAQTALAAAQADVRAAEAARAAAGARLEALAALDAELRRRLAEAADAMPADATGLADDVELNVVALRAQGAAVAGAERDLADARRRFQAAGTLVRDAEADLAAARSAKAAADARALTIAAAEAALAAEPLVDVGMDAGTALDGPELEAADARLAADLPEELLARARARLAIARAEQADANDGAAAAKRTAAVAATAQGGRPAASAQGAAALDAAEGAYLDTLHGREELDGALAAIAAVTARPPLSDDRRARMTTGAVAAAGRAAAEAEQTRDEARATVREKRVAYLRMVLVAVDQHPESDPSEDGDVQTAAGELQTALEALSEAEQALDLRPAPEEPTPREAFGRWEATVPDETWAALLALEDARRTLSRLRDVDSSELREQLALAEDALGDAIAAEAGGNRAVRALLALTTDRTEAAAVAARTSSDLSITRGDA